MDYYRPHAIARPIVDTFFFFFPIFVTVSFLANCHSHMGSEVSHGSHLQPDPQGPADLQSVGSLAGGGDSRG